MSDHQGAESELLAAELAATFVSCGVVVSKQTPESIVALSLDERRAVAESLKQVCAPVEDLSEGQAGRLGFLVRTLGKSSINKTVFEHYLQAKASIRIRVDMQANPMAGRHSSSDLGSALADPL